MLNGRGRAPPGTCGKSGRVCSEAGGHETASVGGGLLPVERLRSCRGSRALLTLCVPLRAPLPRGDHEQFAHDALPFELSAAANVKMTGNPSWARRAKERRIKRRKPASSVGGSSITRQAVTRSAISGRRCFRLSSTDHAGLLGSAPKLFASGSGSAPRRSIQACMRVRPALCFFW